MINYISCIRFVDGIIFIGGIADSDEEPEMSLKFIGGIVGSYEDHRWASDSLVESLVQMRN